MSAKKQTAVDWLVEQICGDHTSPWQKEIDQAKAMEKNQIINAVSVGYDYCEDGKVRWMGEQYYAETYGKD